MNHFIYRILLLVFRQGEVVTITTLTVITLMFIIINGRLNY